MKLNEPYPDNPGNGGCRIAVIIILTALVSTQVFSSNLTKWWESQDRQDWNENYIYYQAFQHQLLTNQFKVSNKKAFLINICSSLAKEGCDELCKYGYIDQNSTIFDKTKGADIKGDLRNTIVISGASICLNLFCDWIYNKWFEKYVIKITEYPRRFTKKGNSKYKKVLIKSIYQEFNINKI